MGDERRTALDRADRLYARLLWLLPGGFRREYGAVMRQTFADRCAARVDTRGRGLTLVLAQEVADLGGGAVGEWAATVFARDRWHRSAATGLCVLAGLLVLYSQARYPASLLTVDHLTEYPLLIAVLAGLALAFARGATVSPRAVGCAVATVPGWLAGSWVFGYVLALIGVAAVLEARRGGSRYAGVAVGVLAGVSMLCVRVATGILGMSRLVRDAGYVHSGQSDPAAYVMGGRVCAGAILLVGCVAVGAVAGVAGRFVRRAGRAVTIMQ